MRPNKALLVNSRSGGVFHGVGVWLRSGCARADSLDHSLHVPIFITLNPPSVQRRLVCLSYGPHQLFLAG